MSVQNNYTLLKENIEKKKARVCVVGMGYVGLPLAVALAHKGFYVYGLDSNASRIKKLKSAQSYIVDVDPQEVVRLIKNKTFSPTTDTHALKDSDVIIICVPTPLRKVKVPDISYVVKASKMIAHHLRRAQLIILESTSFPTTTREVVLPNLMKSNLTPEEDFFLCFSPERVNPGSRRFPLTKIPKVIGGMSPRGGRLAKSLYSKIIKKIFLASCPEIAETSKLLENTFRLVNIALANEFAIVCSKLGISVWEVIDAAATKPFGFMPFYPGPGTGGHCIPCDPLYLSWKAKKLGFSTRMIDLASQVNHCMPHYVVQRVSSVIKAQGTSLNKADILILGVTYKKNVKDLRESPALDLIEELRRRGAHVDYFDPLIPYLKVGGIDSKRIALTKRALRRYTCVILVTDHTSLDYSFIQSHARLIFDTRRVYRKRYDNVRML